MRYRFYIFFGFFTLFFLFYPGNTLYHHIFAYNRDLFERQVKKSKYTVGPIPFVKNDSQPQVSAEGVYIVDLRSFTPIYEKNSRQKFLPASTTKIITALVSFDIYDIDQIITIRKTTTEGQLMGLIENEKITVENLLYGILVHSGNDAAYALAENYGFDKFIKLMNEKAQSLGMKDSVFFNPAGFDDYNQLTTPYDLSLAARELLKNKLLKKIVSTKEIVISDADFKYFHKLSNVNRLLGEIEGVGGLKTGYTENAGENLVSFYKKNGHEFLFTILKSGDRFSDTRNIIKWIEGNIDYLPEQTIDLID